MRQVCQALAEIAVDNCDTRMSLKPKTVCLLCTLTRQPEFVSPQLAVLDPKDLQRRPAHAVLHPRRQAVEKDG